MNCTQQINLSLGLCACGSCYVLKTPQRFPDFTGGSLLLGAICWPCPLTIFSSRSQRGAAALMGRGYGTLTGCCATRLPPLACFMLPVPLICPQGVRNGMGRRCGSSQRTSWACNSLLNSNFGFKNGYAPPALSGAHRTDASESPSANVVLAHASSKRGDARPQFGPPVARLNDRDCLCQLATCQAAGEGMNTVVSPTPASVISNLRGATSLSCAFSLEIRRRLSRSLRWLKRLFGNSDFAGSLSHNVDLNRRAKNALMLTTYPAEEIIKARPYMDDPVHAAYIRTVSGCLGTGSEIISAPGIARCRQSIVGALTDWRPVLPYRSGCPMNTMRCSLSLARVVKPIEPGYADGRHNGVRQHLRAS